MDTISPARKTAYTILMAMERGQSHSDDLLRGKAVTALSPADRNLTTTLVLGVLRWQIRLDQQLRPLLKRPNAKLDAEILIVLRLGAFQLLHLDRIPAPAAIDESVELAKQAGHRFASGMVNAVLRKLAAARAERVSTLSKSAGFADLAITPPDEQEAPGHDLIRAENAAKAREASVPEGSSAAELILAHAHPAWMVERWNRFYGLAAARSICIHGQSQPALTLRLQDPTAEAEFIQTGIQLEPGELLTAARALLSGDVAATDAFREGRVRIQDEGSQLVGEIAANACGNLDRKVKNILDTCAAPGGKTLILAERHPQARIVACESSPLRLEQLRLRLAPHAERIECRQADAAALTEEAVYDLALTDVPCSGTGTLGRNPEIRHRLRLEDLPRQAERQRAILRAALRAVHPGGRVVYSTCSLEPEENEHVIAAVLADGPNARALSLESSIDSLLAGGILTPGGAQHLRRSLTPEGALRLLPGVFGTDGFFIALIERIG